MSAQRFVRRLLVLMSCLLVTVALAQSSAPAIGGPPPGFDPVKMLNDRLAAYAEQDKSSPPPQSGIVFVGSSIFEQWAAVKEHMSPMPVFNRAIGGTITSQQLQYMDTLALKYKPQVIVYYCGSNDVNAGIGADEIAANVRKYVERVARELPDTQVIVTSILRAPQKQAMWNIVNDANAKLADYAVRNPRRVTYVDLNPAVFDVSGAPRLELYQDDRLHYKALAYEEFARIVKPVLQRVWGK